MGALLQGRPASSDVGPPCCGLLASAPPPANREGRGRCWPGPPAHPEVRRPAGAHPLTPGFCRRSRCPNGNALPTELDIATLRTLCGRPPAALASLTWGLSHRGDRPLQLPDLVLFLFCFEKWLVVYLRETGRKNAPRTPGKCFPSGVSQRSIALKGDESWASGLRAGRTSARQGRGVLGTGGTGPHPGSWPGRAGLERRHGCRTHTLCTLGVPAGRWGCSRRLGGPSALDREAPCRPRAMSSDAALGMGEGAGRGPLCRSPSPDPEPLLVRYATLSESQDWPGRSPFPRPRQEGPACRMPPEPWASLCSGHALCPPARQPVSRPGPGRLPPRVLCAPWPGHRLPATRCLGLLVVCVRMGCPGSPGCEAGGLTPSRFASQEPGDART